MKKLLSQSFLVGILAGFVYGATPACAKTVTDDAPTPPVRSSDAEVFDPLEPVNRLMFGINDGVDLVILRPVIEIWKGLMPQPIQTVVANVFNNLDDVFAGASQALQGNGNEATSDFGRVIVNTTIGIGGAFDVATTMGIKKTRGDFGQTLGVWGVPAGPYLVLPLLGPSTARETVGRAGRYYLDPRTYMQPDLGYSLVGLEYVQTRADSQNAETLLDVSSFDKYVFVRNLYLQRRAAMVREGLESHAAQ